MRTLSGSLKPAYKKQNAAELKRMAAWYGERYQEVYLLRCLNCLRVIGVECAPANGSELVTDRGRALFTYQDLCLSVRQRLDTNAQGMKMMGYECVCGNQTKLATVETGLVATQTVLLNKSGDVVSKSKPIPASSPYEMAQIAATVRLAQASSQTSADYELNETVERFESFQLERVK